MTSLFFIVLRFIQSFLTGPTLASFCLFSVFTNKQINVKNVMSIQYTVQGFEPTPSQT